MFKTVVPITIKDHKNLSVKAINGFSFAKDVNLASIMAHEFSRASSIYPIVFIEDGDNFKPVVLFGLEQGENLFVGEDSKWKSSYIPAIIRRFPFALAKVGDGSQYTVCIDKDSEYVNEKDEGERLFNEDGTPSESIERVKKYLSELQQMDMFTNQFTKYCQEKNLFTPLNMKVKVQSEMKNISGAYVINEERINSLSDDTFLEMHKKRYLSIIYSHLSSLAQIERLLSFKDESLSAIEKVEDRFEDLEKPKKKVTK
jgi:hypothetical protein